MGLDAFVHCRCATDGGASPPPSTWELTQDGLVCDKDLNMETLLAFDRWLNDGCPHKRMQHRLTHISNWAGYRQFQTALDRVGAEHFPVLTRELPQANGGWTASTDALSCLEELASFEQSTETWPRVELIDSSSGHVFAKSVNEHDGVFILFGSEGWRARLTAAGTFVVEASEADRLRPVVLFEATEFTQTATADGQWQWVAPSSESFSTAHRFSVHQDDGTVHSSSVLRVVERQVGPASVGIVVAALREIFEASVAIDMPVHWT